MTGLPLQKLLDILEQSRREMIAAAEQNGWCCPKTVQLSTKLDEYILIYQQYIKASPDGQPGKRWVDAYDKHIHLPSDYKQTHPLD